MQWAVVIKSNELVFSYIRIVRLVLDKEKSLRRDGREDVERPARVLGLFGAVGHLLKGAPVPTHVLPKVLTGYHVQPPGVEVS